MFGSGAAVAVEKTLKQSDNASTDVGEESYCSDERQVREQLEIKTELGKASAPKNDVFKGSKSSPKGWGFYFLNRRVS